VRTYPPGFATVLHFALAGLLASGLLLVPGALQMRLEWNLPWALGDGARVWVAATHAACFFTLLALLGAVWTVHMRAGWLRRENRLSGAALLAAFGVLAVSGLGLYYAGGETLPRWSVIAHLLAGSAVPALYVAHRLGARAAAARAWPERVRNQSAAARASTARIAPSASHTVSTRS